MKVKIDIRKVETLRKVTNLSIVDPIIVVRAIPAFHPFFDYKFIYNRKMYYFKEEDIIEHVFEFEKEEFEI
jgi:hypothetical protein